VRWRLSADGGFSVRLLPCYRHQAPSLALSTKAFRLRLIFRARSSASHDLEHLKPPLLLAIYRLTTHWKLSSVSQKSTLLV